MDKVLTVMESVRLGGNGRAATMTEKQRMEPPIRLYKFDGQSIGSRIETGAIP